MKHDILRKFILGSGLTVALVLASGCSNGSATNGMKPMSADEHQKMQSK